MCGVNVPPMFDIANVMDFFIKDINHTISKILRPIYEKMYQHHANSDEKIQNHLGVAQKALFKAGAILELFKAANKRLPVLQMENLRNND